MRCQTSRACRVECEQAHGNPAVSDLKIERRVRVRTASRLPSIRSLGARGAGRRTHRISRLHSTGKRPFYRGWPAVGSCRKSLWRRKDEDFSRDRQLIPAVCVLPCNVTTCGPFVGNR